MNEDDDIAKFFLQVDEIVNTMSDHEEIVDDSIDVKILFYPFQLDLMAKYNPLRRFEILVT